MITPIVSNSSILNFPGCLFNLSGTPDAFVSNPPLLILRLPYAGVDLISPITTCTSSSESESLAASPSSWLEASLIPFLFISVLFSFGILLVGEDSSSGGSASSDG